MSALPPPGSKVAIYARYSTNLQTFKSIEDQIELCRVYAAKQGWEVVATYHDAERSGTTTVGRDGLFSMMAAADRGEFVIVLVEDVDRLSRNAADTHGLVDELAAVDVTVCTVGSGVMSNWEVAFKAVSNADYVKQLGMKTRRGQEGTVKSGRISGSVAYGYNKAFKIDGENGHREIDAQEAGIVRRIFENYDSGVSTIDICKALNAEGIPGPRNKPWSAGTLTGTKALSTGILRNTTYVGKFKWGKTSRKRISRTGKVKVKPTKAADWLVSDRPDLRILDDALFERVQDRLESRSHGHFSQYRAPDYLFTRKTVCGVCGGSCALLNKRIGCMGRSRKGTCTNGRRVKREDLEEAVLSGLIEQILQPEIIEGCIADYRAEFANAMAEQQTRAEFRKGRLEDLEKQIANVMAQVRSGGGSGFAADLLAKELERLGAEQEQLLREERAAPQIAPLDLDENAIVERLTALLTDLRTALEGSDKEAVRARDIIRSMIDRIVITPIDEGKVDGRGAGAVQLTVEGSLSRLLDHADTKVGRVILQGSRTETMQGVPNLQFRFYVDIPYENPRLVNGGYDDLAVMARMLDDSDRPVTNRKLREALEKIPLPATAPQVDPVYRVRRIATYLEDRGKIRAVLSHPSRTGWVWNHVPLTDEQWKERMRHPEPTGPAVRVVRVQAPEASPVIISRLPISVGQPPHSSNS